MDSIFAFGAYIVFVLPSCLTVLPNFNRVRSRVDACFSLGAVSVAEQKQQVVNNSVRSLKSLVLRRAGERFFEKDTLDLLVRNSGGILKDLFYLIAESSLNAMVAHLELQVIKEEDVWKSCMKLKAEYFRCIQSKEHYDCVKAIYCGLQETADSAILADLLQNNAILDYGCDKRLLLHPLIADSIASNRL